MYKQHQATSTILAADQFVYTTSNNTTGCFQVSAVSLSDVWGVWEAVRMIQSNTDSYSGSITWNVYTTSEKTIETFLKKR